MIKSVIFDLDGTLVYTLPDIAASVNAALKEQGFAERSLEEFCGFVGDGVAKMVERALPDAERTPKNCKKTLQSFRRHYAEHCVDSSRPYPGIEELLDSLKAAGMKLAVFSNKDQAFTETIVRSLFKGKFDVIVGARPSLPKKPDPTGAFFVMRKLRVNSDECFLVGDSANDMETASACGAVSIGVLWGYRSREELASSGARFICENPSKIAVILKEINQ